MDVWLPGRLNRHQHLGELYDLTEVFAGRGAISKAFVERGLKATTFDVRQDPLHNVHTRQGVLICAEKMAFAKPLVGIAIFEPTCGSWIWCNLGSSLRGIVTRLMKGDYLAFPV